MHWLCISDLNRLDTIGGGMGVDRVVNGRLFDLSRITRDTSADRDMSSFVGSSDNSSVAA